MNTYTQQTRSDENDRIEEDRIVRKAIYYIEKNIDNSEYSVKDLSFDVGMSRATLYRKFLSTTGYTPANFIRMIRLKKAASLIENTHYYISEIAYMVGFGTIKYFNINFKNTFSMTPQQYRIEKNLHKDIQFFQT